MLEQIIRFSIGQRGLVLILVLLLAGLGVWNFTRLPIDAVPDITNVQVVVNTPAPGYTPLEVEQRVSFPLENAMAGLPRLDYTRSISRYGLSQITIVFEDDTDIYFARQQVAERLNAARATLPASLEPALVLLLFYSAFADMWLSPITYILVMLVAIFKRYVSQRRVVV